MIIVIDCNYEQGANLFYHFTDHPKSSVIAYLCALFLIR